MLEKNIEIPREKIAEFCQGWKITEFALFGSVLRDDFRPDSDIDALVKFAPDAKWTLLDHVDMHSGVSGYLWAKSRFSQSPRY